MKKEDKKRKLTSMEWGAISVISVFVIVILAFAITSFLDDSKKDRFLEMMNQYISGARAMATSNKIEFPTDPNTVEVVSLRAIKIDGETDPTKTKSPYGYPWVMDENKTSSYVAIRNSQTETNPKYLYYFVAVDTDGNCIHLTQEGKERKNNLYKNCMITEINEETTSIMLDGRVFSLPPEMKILNK